jgi:hypothetical protein
MQPFLLICFSGKPAVPTATTKSGDFPYDIIKGNTRAFSAVFENDREGFIKSCMHQTSTNVALSAPQMNDARGLKSMSVVLVWRFRGHTTVPRLSIDGGRDSGFARTPSNGSASKRLLTIMAIREKVMLSELGS